MDRARYVLDGIRAGEALIETYYLPDDESFATDGRGDGKRLEQLWTSTFDPGIYVDGELYRIVTFADDRHWCDIALQRASDGVWFYYNFKVGSSPKAGNLGGTAMLSYLFLNAVDGTSVPRLEENGLAQRVAAARRAGWDQTPREYFCIDYYRPLDPRERFLRVVPIASLAWEDLYVNPRNGFQSNLHDAGFDPYRSQDEACEFLYRKFEELAKKQAATLFALWEAPDAA